MPYNTADAGLNTASPSLQSQVTKLRCEVNALRDQLDYAQKCITALSRVVGCDLPPRSPDMPSLENKLAY